MTTAEKLIRAKADIDAVYEAGKAQGGGGNYYDTFWDIYQQDGKRTNYEGGFSGRGWNAETLKPKYSVKAKATYMMFAYCGYTGDLDDVFKNRGLSFEIVERGSGNDPVGYMFYQSLISAVGTIDISSYSGTNDVASMFNTTSLVTIRNLIPPQCAMGTTCWQSGLVNLGIGGEITKDFSLGRCSKLSAESVQSVIDHLADLTGQTAQTVTFHSTVANRLTEEQTNAILNKNWNIG